MYVYIQKNVCILYKICILYINIYITTRVSNENDVCRDAAFITGSPLLVGQSGRISKSGADIWQRADGLPFFGV